MDNNLLKGTTVSYKYAIFSNRLDELNDPVEVLYMYGVSDTTTSDNLNRCLRIPDDKCRLEGTPN